MAQSNKQPPLSPRSLLIAAAISIALAFSTQSGPLLRPYFSADWISAIPYFRSMLISLADLGLLAGLAAAAAWRSPQHIIGLAGLNAPILLPVLFALICFAPATVIAFLSAPVAELDPGIWWLGLGAPFFEELGYRGIAIGVLMRLCGWSFWPAALLPAVFFGAAHFWNGDDLGSIAGIIAITGLGGVLFGWLFVRWGFNFWPPFFLHAGLNTLWGVFALGENAIGGWFGNALRLGVVAIAIAATLLMTKNSGKPQHHSA